MWALAKIFQEFTVVAIPTRTNFRGINVREAALFRGSEGWSEFSPFIEYEDGEASTWLKAAIEGAYVPWPKARRDFVSVNATLPRVSEDQVGKILDRFPGCTTVKIKVDDFETDSSLVEATLVNGGWTLSEALVNLYNFHLRFGNVFEYVEQPCLNLADLAALKKEVPMKIAVDESIRKYLNSDLTSLSECADIAIIKWAPSGGISAALDLVSTIGLPAVVSSALDTGIGISHGVALAASLPDLDFACGLGTVSLLNDDVVEPALIPEAGKIKVGRQTPDSDLLGRYRAGEDRHIWWQNRVERIWEKGLSKTISEQGWLN